MTWSVVLPSGDSQNLQITVTSILEAHPYFPVERIVAVVDFDPAVLPTSFRGIRFIPQKTPFVFSEAVNDGISCISSGNVALVEDDVTIATVGAFDILDRLAEDSAGTMIFHPAVDGNTMGHDFMNASPETKIRDDIVEFPYICPFFSRRVLEAVGRFDQSFTGYGKDDYDYCVRARQQGFKLALIPKVRIGHHIDRSVYRRRSDLQDLLRFNHRRLKEKWGIESP